MDKNPRLTRVLQQQILQIKLERHVVQRRRKELAQERLSHVRRDALAYFAPKGVEGILARQARSWLVGRWVPAKWRSSPLAFAYVAMPVRVLLDGLRVGL